MSLRASRGGAPTVTPLDTRGCTCAREGILTEVDDGAGNGPTGRSPREPQNPLRTRTSARAKDSTVGAVGAGGADLDIRKRQAGLTAYRFGADRKGSHFSQSKLLNHLVSRSRSSLMNNPARSVLLPFVYARHRHRYLYGIISKAERRIHWR